MKWTSSDKNQVANLIIGLRKAKIELTGPEIVAFADAYKWINGLYDHIEKELSPKALPFVPTPAPTIPEVSPEPIPVKTKKNK